VWGAGQTHHGRGKGIIRHLGCWADAASKSLKSPTLTKKQQVPAMKMGNWNSNLQVNLSTIDKIDDALKTGRINKKYRTKEVTEQKSEADHAYACVYIYVRIYVHM
jgi:hypothetical protein